MLGAKKSEEWMVLCIFPSFPGRHAWFNDKCSSRWLWVNLVREASEAPTTMIQSRKVSVGSESKNIFWSPASYTSLTGSQNIDILDSDKSFLLCVSTSNLFIAFPVGVLSLTRMLTLLYRVEFLPNKL